MAKVPWAWPGRVSSIDNLLWNSTGQRVEEQGQEQHCDEQDQGDDDVFLVALPHQVEETLKWIDEPREGSVRSAGGRERVSFLGQLRPYICLTYNLP